MRTLPFGDKSAFLGQHVFHFHVHDDYKKKFTKCESAEIGNLGVEH